MGEAIAEFSVLRVNEEVPLTKGYTRPKALPPNKQQEALRLLDTLASGPGSEPHGTSLDRRPLWEIVEEVNARLPKDAWGDLPTDGSINLDHYLYGALNQQP